MGTAWSQELHVVSDVRRLLVVEDHDIIVAGLRSALLEASGTAGSCQLFCVKSLPAALEALQTPFNLILLDLAPPRDGDPLLGLKLLRQRHPDVPVAIFSDNESPLLMRDALQAGAAGFIPKRTETPTIVAIVEFMLKGGVYLPPQAISTLVSPTHTIQVSSGRSFAGHSLTPRQQSVMELLLEGHSNKEIARVLGLTLGTVKNYVSELLKTTHAKTRSQILATVRLQPRMQLGEAEAQAEARIA